MKKGILGILFVIFIYCAFHLLAFHETLVQIEHSEPLQVSCQNALNINTEPKENGFITDIVLPTGIIYKRTQLEIKSDVQQNAVIKLAGPRVAYNNTYKKYTIDYRNACVNNEKILSKGVTASFLKPFSYSIDNLLTAVVDFEYKTDFVLRNMSVVCFICMVIVLLIVSGYVAYVLYPRSKFVSNAISKCYTVLNSEELLSLVVNGYKNIRKEYKICFWVNFIVLNIVYLYLNMNFLFGSHDWDGIRKVYNYDGTAFGRFSIVFLIASSVILLFQW